MPELVSCVDDRRALGDAGVVDENVRVAKTLAHLAEHARDTLGIGDVADERDRFVADLTSDLFDLFGSPCSDGNARAKAEAMLGRVGLASRLRHYPKFLSGGEQQRVALARAFVTEPPLLLADEPTGSLDAATGEALIQLMFELNRERGSTLVLVTHDSGIAARCGRTITIAAGRVV